MKKLSSTLCLAPVLSCLFTPVFAADDVKATSESKRFGVSLEWYQHQLDLEVLDLDANIPGVSKAVLNSMKGQLNTKNDFELFNFRLDYQVNPRINLYAAVGKFTDETEVDFSSALPGASSAIIDNKGTAFTVGTRLSKQHGKWLSSVNLAHTRLNLDENKADVTINTLVPSVGRQINLGVISASLVYQAVKASYDSTVTVPMIGDVPVTVNTKNMDNFQIMAGWKVPLAKDTSLDTKLGLNGEKQLHIQLNKRF